MKFIAKNKSLPFSLFFASAFVLSFVAAYGLSAMLAPGVPDEQAAEPKRRQLFQNYRFLTFFLDENLPRSEQEIDPSDRQNPLLADIGRIQQAERFSLEKKYAASDEWLGQVSGRFPHIAAKGAELRLRNLHGRNKSSDFIAYYDSHRTGGLEIKVLLIDSLLKNGQNGRAQLEFKRLFLNRTLSPFLKIISRPALAVLLKGLDEDFWLKKFSFLLKSGAKAEFRLEAPFCRFAPLTRLFQAEFAYRERNYSRARLLLQGGLGEKYHPNAEKILLKMAVRQDPQADITDRLQALSGNGLLYRELLLDLATILAGKKEYAKAGPLYSLYLQHSREQGDEYWKTVWLLAWTHYRQGRPDLAREFFARGGESPIIAYRIASQYWDSKLGNGGPLQLHDYPFSYYAVKTLPDKARFKDLQETFVSAIDKAPGDRFLEIFNDLQILSKYGLWQDCLETIHAAKKDPRLNDSARNLLKIIESLIHVRQNQYFQAYSSFRDNFKSIESIRLPNFLSAIFFPRHYSELIDTYSKKQQVDPLLVHALIREESFFRPDSLSTAKAHGLMQLLLGTARQIAGNGRLKIRASDLYDPELNIRLGMQYLKSLLDRYDGRLYLALAAYNAGPHRVKQWLEDFPDAEEEEFIEMIPFSETRNYVKNILRNYFFYRYYYDTDKT